MKKKTVFIAIISVIIGLIALVIFSKESIRSALSRNTSSGCWPALSNEDLVVSSELIFFESNSSGVYKLDNNLSPELNDSPNELLIGYMFIEGNTLYLDEIEIITREDEDRILKLDLYNTK